MSRPIPAAVEYPSSHGKPMAENDAQRDAIMYAIDVLKTRFAGREDVYVSGDLLIYYEEGKMRFRDPVTGQDLLGYEEEHAARLAAEARIAELEALLRTRRG